MSAERQFVDTNVLVYAHDRSAGDKHTRARTLLAELWDSQAGCLSIQVLQEFYVNITRKVARPLDPADARQIVADLGHWRVHSPTVNDVLEAIALQQRHGLSFWDAMIVTSAIQLGCTIVWSEDLNAGQDYDGVQASAAGTPSRAHLEAGRCHGVNEYAANQRMASRTGLTAWPMCRSRKGIDRHMLQAKRRVAPEQLNPIGCDR